MNVSEDAILCGIYKFGIEGLNEVRDIVNETSFSDTQNQLMFSIMSSVLEGQHKIDMAAFLNKASELKVSDRIDIGKLQSIEIDIDSMRPLAKKIKRLEIIRSASSMFKKTYENIQKLNGSEPLSEILSIIESPVFGFSNAVSSQDTGTQPLFDDINEWIEWTATHPTDNVGLSTSYPSLDQAIGGGMRRKSVSLFAARTGVGKTTLAVTVARFNAKQGIPVLVLDTEMSSTDYKVKSLAAESKVDIGLIEHGKFAGFSDMNLKVRNAGKKLQEYPIDYINISGKSFEEILSIARRWLALKVGKTDGVLNDCLIIYDYFKIMDQGSLENLQEYQALGFQISKLHDFCVQYDVPAMTFVQLNRDGIDKEDLSGISQSDRLAWLASNVVLFKDKTIEEVAQNPDMGNMKMIPLKTRYGPNVKFGDYICLNKLGRYAIIQEVGLKSELEPNAGKNSKSDF